MTLWFILIRLKQIFEESSIKSSDGIIKNLVLEKLVQKKKKKERSVKKTAVSGK